jgi:anti-sigma-K factor RskA
MRKLSRQLAHALAAEYVVGTLRGAARRRFEAIARDDATVAAVLGEWERGLTPLAQSVPPVDPPARVWKAIEERIAPRVRENNRGLGFWRSFGLLAGGVASVLLAAFLYISTGTRGEPVFVAVLTEPSEPSPRMMVSMHMPNLLRVRVMHPWKMGPEQSLELWVMPKEGAPRSLGLVANSQGDTMIQLDPADPRVQGAQWLAVTMEPVGGSPTKQPTGKPVCTGMIAPVRKI